MAVKGGIKRRAVPVKVLEGGWKLRIICGDVIETYPKVFRTKTEVLDIGREVLRHPRNITDDQAVACAETGGVVGITGVGIFLGPNTPTLDAMARHLEAAVELVGIDHVGVSTDHSFDQADFRAELATNPELFDESYTRWGPLEWVSPELFVTLDDVLLARGWSQPDVDAVTSGNFRRVAEAAW